MLEELSREEVHAAVDRAVEELLAAAGITGPPVDAIALAQRHLGMVICLDREQPQRGRAQRTAGRKQIFLRPEPSEERHQWTVAHEVAEHLKRDLLRRLGIDPDFSRPMLGESLANLFAFRLLAPGCWFGADARACGFDLIDLKQRYRSASHEVLALRMLDLAEPCGITIVDNGSVYKRKSNAFRLPKELGPAERKCLRRVSEANEPAVVRQGGWTVQGWPVHQAEWKREVLRSVMDEDWTEA